jgi:hypothetical protein
MRALIGPVMTPERTSDFLRATAIRPTVAKKSGLRLDVSVDLWNELQWPPAYW